MLLGFCAKNRDQKLARSLGSTSNLKRSGGFKYLHETSRFFHNFFVLPSRLPRIFFPLVYGLFSAVLSSPLEMSAESNRRCDYSFYCFTRFLRFSPSSGCSRFYSPSSSPQLNE
jgi:hypothetical protein